MRGRVPSRGGPGKARAGARGGGNGRFKVSEPVHIGEVLEEVRAELARLRERAEAHERELAELREEAGARREVLDLDGAARLLGVSRRTIERRLAEGTLPHFKVGADRCVRIERSALLNAARRGFPALRAGRSRLHSKLHFPGSAERNSGKRA